MVLGRCQIVAGESPRADPRGRACGIVPQERRSELADSLRLLRRLKAAGFPRSRLRGITTHPRDLCSEVLPSWITEASGVPCSFLAPFRSSRSTPRGGGGRYTFSLSFRSPWRSSSCSWSPSNSGSGVVGVLRPFSVLIFVKCFKNGDLCKSING